MRNFTNLLPVHTGVNRRSGIGCSLTIAKLQNCCETAFCKFRNL